MMDRTNNSHAKSFHLLGSSKKKKKKKKSKSEKINGETDEKAGNPFLHPSFSSWHADREDTEEYQTQQPKSKKKKKEDKREKPDSQLENSWVGTESNLGSKALTGTTQKKRKRKHRSSEQDDVSQFYVPETPEEADNLPEADPLEDVGDTCEIPPKKKEKKKKERAKAAKASSEEQVEPGEASVGGTDFVSDLEETQDTIQAAGLLQTEVEERPLVSEPSARSSSPAPRKRPHRHKKRPSVSSTTGGSHATEDGLSAKDTAQADEKQGKPEQHHEMSILTKKMSSGKLGNYDFEDLKFTIGVIESQDTEDSQTQQSKSKKRKREDRGEKPDSQLENSWVGTESNLGSEALTGTTQKKRKRKHRSSEQDDVSQFYVPETPEEADNLPEADPLEDVGDTCEIPPKKKEKKKKERAKAAKASSEEQVEPGEASVGGTDFVGDLEETQDTIQAAGLLQTEVEERPLVSEPSARSSSPAPRKRPHRHKKRPSVSSTTGGSHATEDGLSAKDTAQADEKQGKPEQHHELEKKRSFVRTDERESSSPKHHTSELFELDNEFLESPELPTQDLEIVTQELEEFIPHVRKLSEPLIRQLARRDLVRFKNFKKQGISVRFGKFSKQENELLRKNLEAFLEESGVDSPEKLLFPDRFPEEKADLRKLKSEHLFSLKIAQGIPRPCKLVYYRARKMFDPQNYAGRYSRKEKKKLKKYQALYGNNWKKISELIGRSSHSVERKYYEITSAQSEFHSGPWSREETKKLVEALKRILKAKVEGLDSTQEPKDLDQAQLLRESLYKDIPWVQVEAKVGTRDWKQCKKKWMSIITKKMSQGKMRNRGFDSVKFKIEVIERLYELNVENLDEIDWEDLSRLIGNVPPDYVRSRFHKIKSMYVPSWNRKSFSEAIDHLYKETLPKLKSRVAGREREEVEAGDGAWKKTFWFSDIFRDEDYDDDLIEDESESEEEKQLPRPPKTP